MRFYFATSSKYHLDMLLGLGVKNILIAGQHRTLVNAIKDNPEINLIIDSGAYTAWSVGKKVNLSNYIDFCVSVQNNNNLNELRVVNLDIIPGRFGTRPTQAEIDYAAAEGWDNYEWMKFSGIKAMHIFHQFESFRWLIKLMEEDTDYIGISPANDLKSPKKRRDWLKEVYEIVQDKKKTHGFGVTDFSIVKEIPFYSADSSNWSSLVRYGRMSIYDEFKIKVYQYKYLEESLKLGINPKALTNYSLLRDELSKAARNILLMEGDITKLWDERGIIPGKQ